MKLTFDLKKYLGLEKVLSPALVFILSLLYFHVGIIQQVSGSEIKKEPHISLKAENQPLGDVLKKITLETGFKFKLNDQWSSYPVNASIKDVPIHKGLQLILRGLNHAIIYESDKSIKILVYEKGDSRQSDSYPIQSLSLQIQGSQQEPAPLPESSPEETVELRRTDDSSEETGSQEINEEQRTENQDSSENREKETTEETGEATGKEVIQEPAGQSENQNEQNERQNTAEDSTAENSQKQN